MKEKDLWVEKLLDTIELRIEQIVGKKRVERCPAYLIIERTRDQISTSNTAEISLELGILPERDWACDECRGCRHP